MAMHPELCRQLVLQEVEPLRSQNGDGWQLVEVDFPHLYVRFQTADGVDRIIRFTCDNYDYQPLGIEPVDPVTHEPLTREAWMRRGAPGQYGDFPNHPMKNNMPFLCLEGTRDFYLYPGHEPTLTGSRWENWRYHLRIPDLIKTIAGKFRDGTWK